MNVYKDFVIVHNMQLDPRDVKLFVDWLLSCEPDSQAYKIGEAMQAAIDNYIDTFKIYVNNKYGITNYCDICLQDYLNRESTRPLQLEKREYK